MSFQAFTDELLTWVTWWNTEHHPAELHGATPLRAWQADLTALNDVSPADVWSFTLEDDGRTRTITSHGVRCRNRDYIADWMAGQAGREVTVRFMPHHNHEIEICTPHGRRLGSAHLADQATLEQLGALCRANPASPAPAGRGHSRREAAPHAVRSRHRGSPGTPPGCRHRL
jgi:putative transposase